MRIGILPARLQLHSAFFVPMAADTSSGKASPDTWMEPKRSQEFAGAVAWPDAGMSSSAVRTTRCCGARDDG